ncbi:MAG: hypothetical protein IJ822_03805 [Pyramidobacter sp.]|nr:hypothetical protein [Pyramidobacter sp.]MBQ8129376.1 hypothetical protein [Clostridia bacterium]MBR1895886.1 hypothetical protein [Pyramidobacter sp.]
MGFELLCNMQVLSGGEPVCEFTQVELAVPAGYEDDFPTEAFRPVSIGFTMPRKDARRMNAVWRQSEAVIWRKVARVFGWSTKRMRRMKKSNRCGSALMFLALAELDGN